MTSLERMYWFYQQLRRKRYPSRRQFQEEHEVSESTFKRDLSFFRDRLGAPLSYDQARNGYYLTDASFELPSFWFNRPQLLLMIGICKQLQQMDSEEGSRPLIEFRQRLERMLTMEDGRAVTDLFSFENVEWTRCDCRHIDNIIQAMLDKTCLTLTYHTGRDDMVRERRVEPYRLHYYMGSWYLIAFCHHKNKPRTFQLGRILGLVPIMKRFGEFRFNVSSYIDDAFGIFKGKSTIPVVLRFDPFIARFIKNEVWHQDQKVEEDADGGLTMTLPVADLTEIRMKALKYGGRVEVMALAELRRQVAEEARKITKIYK